MKCKMGSCIKAVVCTAFYGHWNAFSSKWKNCSLSRVKQERMAKPRNCPKPRSKTHPWSHNPQSKNKIRRQYALLLFPPNVMLAANLFTTKLPGWVHIRQTRASKLEHKRHGLKCVFSILIAKQESKDSECTDTSKRRDSNLLLCEQEAKTLDSSHPEVHFSAEEKEHRVHAHSLLLLGLQCASMTSAHPIHLGGTQTTATWDPFCLPGARTG